MLLASLIVAPVCIQTARADGPNDNHADNVRPVPPLPKTKLSAADRVELEVGVAKLGDEIEAVRSEVKDERLLALLPDVQIYHNAVRYPLVYNEEIDMKSARKALADGLSRATELRGGKAPWLTAGGPHGYVSKIDGSVQPYLLGMPVGFTMPTGLEKSKPYRIDFNEHGRGEDLTELRFINGKATSVAGRFTVQLYGRYCCANKFAGEIDLFECLDSLKRQYPIDENRILNIGFSMGGAACWQFATHYPDVWAAASPGAGFSETREFLHNFQNETVQPAWYEKKLWHWYDCTDYAENLFNCPTIAYSGELDGQKQSADIMEKYMAEQGLKLERIIGPNTKHAYEKNAKIELDKRLDEILAKGRDPVPAKIRFTTWTLRYNRMYWVTIDGMNKHWDRARVEAEIAGNAITAKTQNVAALTIHFPAGQSPFKANDQVSIDLDGTHFTVPTAADGSLTFHWVGKDVPAVAAPLAKVHGLQGPIDDAFMDSFLIVQPTGTATNAKAGAWAAAECKHAIDHWRKQFRGEARVKNDTDITDADIADHNIVLFGDPSSNKVLARIADKLPIKWSAGEIAIGSEKFPADHHALIAIYPNPLNPKRYVVLNSGFTFREYDYLNNARQIPKLPDYAVVDVDVPVNSRTPGGIVQAGFFGEHWELLANQGKD
jgi:pimeloyl-ACP methyl ester carboxylesterase